LNSHILTTPSNTTSCKVAKTVKIGSFSEDDKVNLVGSAFGHGEKCYLGVSPFASSSLQIKENGNPDLSVAYIDTSLAVLRRWISISGIIMKPADKNDHAFIPIEPIAVWQYKGVIKSFLQHLPSPIVDDTLFRNKTLYDKPYHSLK
jgi:hypothetical protein